RRRPPGQRCPAAPEQPRRRANPGDCSAPRRADNGELRALVLVDGSRHIAPPTIRRLAGQKRTNPVARDAVCRPWCGLLGQTVSLVRLKEKGTAYPIISHRTTAELDFGGNFRSQEFFACYKSHYWNLRYHPTPATSPDSVPRPAPRSISLGGL